MLVEFQQALADLTASPDLCIEARREPRLLMERYMLTDREWRRLVGIAQHPGMACACIVYRANRLAPLALNLPRTCKALGAALRDIATEYWMRYPEGNVHFFIETARFCRFLEEKLEAAPMYSALVADVLSEESSLVDAALLESSTEATA